MDLDDFIHQAMVAIAAGIDKARKDDKYGELIVPLIQGKDRNIFGNFHVKDDDTKQATIVQFDVQVSTKSASEGNKDAKAKARLYVVSVEAGGSNKQASESSSSNRIQFSLPLLLPPKLK